MTDGRLSEDQNLLVTVLQGIWSRYARNAVLVVLVVSAGLVGLTVGVLSATRAVLAQTATVISSLEQEVAYNRQTIQQLQQDRQHDAERYQNLMVILQGVKKTAERRE